MTLAASTWALNEADLHNPTEAAVLFAMADRAGDDGTGVWFSHKTLAAKARTSESTVKRTLRELQRRGVIRPGDQAAAAHLPANRRPVVWDLVMPDRRTRLLPKPDILGGQSDLPGDPGGSDSGSRGVTRAGSGGSPVTYKTSSKTRDKTGGDWSAGQRDAFTSGQPVGCRTHGARRPACDACQREGVGLEQTRPASMKVAEQSAAEARAAMRRR